MNLMTGDQYISIILSSNMFKDEYTRQGYESRLLSRPTEDSATVVSVLIPWNTCGMTQATVLGVATLTYLPYTFFCLLSPPDVNHLCRLRLEDKETRGMEGEINGKVKTETGQEVRTEEETLF